jgi:hypothetical protein
LGIHLKGRRARLTDMESTHLLFHHETTDSMKLVRTNFMGDLYTHPEKRCLAEVDMEELILFRKKSYYNPEREDDVMSKTERKPYFVDPSQAPEIVWMKGMETRVLTGLHGERMMMVLNATLPGQTVPVHSHPHEQIGMV